jgi:hypothetical protein
MSHVSGRIVNRPTKDTVLRYLRVVILVNILTALHLAGRSKVNERLPNMTLYDILLGLSVSPKTIHKTSDLDRLN